ncbi:acyltransferase family protein [Streptomyces fulvorobeus]|uniref:Fucose 4-O-acetylase-like acetyltransferase n=1 Tax=Streptomyces fulvorobeus TaxID=284028 RepID=A0A7J0C6J0_9ACTN|nr:acyltransferase family protein [Streptomyces fulvorobeus]NYE41710.1 fucose 4-O-acetylase-like acetyltransferase [Streptomyces fulvorobeus]GFM98080.1 membrane protein [Streptomyces fulvorobeus]
MTSLTSQTPGRAPTGAGTAPAAARAGRDPFFDNAKYLAIVLVAMGHSWEPLPGSGRVVEALYTFVYTFHMPVFIVIAGYFSRGFDLRPERVWKLVTQLLVPYVVFEVAYTVFERLVRNPSQQLTIVDPYWLLWFLPALFIWRLTTPVWQVIRQPVAVSVAIAALAPMASGIGDDLQLQRVLQFLPFYVLGLRLRPHHFDLVRRPVARLLSLPVCAVALLVAYWAVPRISTRWFYRSQSTEELASPMWAGAAMTLLLFAAAVVLSACFLAWVPSRKLWMSALGAGTIYGYLLHGFVIRAASYEGFYDHAFLATPSGRIVLTVAAAVMVTLLCTSPVRRALRVLVEPRMNWALRPRPEPAP